MIQSIKHISHKIKTDYTFCVPFFNVTHSILFKNGPRAPQRPLHLLARAIHTRVSNVHEEDKQTYQLLLPYKNVCGANDSSSKPFILLTDTTAADLHGNNHWSWMEGLMGLFFYSAETEVIHWVRAPPTARRKLVLRGVLEIHLERQMHLKQSKAKS